MSDEHKDSTLDEEAEAALAALRRARLRAEKIARFTGTKLVESLDGNPVLVDPPPVEEA